MSEVKTGEVALLQVHRDLLKRRDATEPVRIYVGDEVFLDS